MVNPTSSGVGAMGAFAAVLLFAQASCSAQGEKPMGESDSRSRVAHAGSLGVCHHFYHSSEEEWRQVLQLLKGSRAQWIRVVVFWREIEPEQGKRDFKKLDGIITDLRGSKLHILVTFVGTPAWASDAGEDESGALAAGSDCYPPKRDEDWADFVHAVVTRYRDRVSHWEIWNEENEYYFFRPEPDPARYTQMLKVAYQACKRADPQCTVLLGGLCFNGIVANPWSPIKTENYLPALYEEGAKQWFDVLAIHPYFLADEGVERMASLIAGTKQAMEEAGDEKKPIWITEIGFAINDLNAADEDEQARLLTEAVERLREDPQIGPMFCFTFQDYAGSVFAGEDTMGLITLEDRRKKPAFFAFQRLARD